MALAEDDITRTIRELSRPGAYDIGLKNSTKTPGKLTWRWSSSGDVEWDDSAGYPVLMGIVAHRGRYRHDRTLGSYLHAVRRQRSTTASQLVAYARDGAAGVEVAGLAEDILIRAQRQAQGGWRLIIRWKAAGKDRAQELRL